MKLYKYYSLSKRDRVEDLLKKRMIFHQNPSKFNDPFEMEHRAITSEKLITSLEHQVRQEFPQYTNEQFDEAMKIAKANFAANEDLAEVRVKDFINRKEFIEPTVACFSAVRDSLLMWAHYASDHKGVCLEFDTDLCGLDGDLYEVSYSEDLPIIDIYEFISRAAEDRDVKKESILTKSKDWSYEKGYRSISFDANKYKEFNLQGLTGIVLGARIDSDNKKWLFDLIKEENININIEQASTSKYKFELVFSKVA